MIHKYKLGGLNIVLDVHSGAVHIVDDVAFELLDLLTEDFLSTSLDDLVEKLAPKYPTKDITETYHELLDLYHNGTLFSEDDYEQYSKMMVSAPIKSMCLHIAHDCNLRCEYCFAATGDFGGGRKLMDFEVGKAAIDFLLENSKGRKNIELDFFGGEPLMNFQVVKQIVEYARNKEKEHNKNFRFTLTTNGLLLNDDNIAYINQEMSNVVLSIDGRKEINDKLRSRVDGTGCYDAIIPKYKKLVESRGGKDYYVRGTFTKYNLDFTKDVLHLKELGFDQISMEPVVTPETEPYAITFDDLNSVFTEYETLADQLIKDRKSGNFYNFFHFMLDLDQGPCAIKRLRGCGCGNEYVAVTPEGDIYPCHQFVGMIDWKMGDVFSKEIDLAKKDYFAQATIYGKEECKKCWAKFYCSGGCNANNFQYEGSVLKPHKLACEMEKKRLECAIMVKASLLVNE